MHMGFAGGRLEYHEQALRSAGIKNGIIDDVFAIVAKEVKALATDWGI